MATKPTQKDASTEIAETTNTALALSASMFADDAGAGMEGATAESFAIPFLSVLQKGSPQVDEASGAALEGATARADSLAPPKALCVAMRLWRYLIGQVGRSGWLYAV